MKVPNTNFFSNMLKITFGIPKLYQMFGNDICDTKLYQMSKNDPNTEIFKVFTVFGQTIACLQALWVFVKFLKN